MKASPLALAKLTDYSTIVVVNGLHRFDLTTRQIRGPRVAVEWVARAWVTQPGTLDWAPNTGVDLTLSENTTVTQLDLNGWRQKLTQAAERVDYVLACRTALTFDAAARALTARGNLTLVDGRAYPLEVSIGLVSQAILALNVGVAA